MPLPEAGAMVPFELDSLKLLLCNVAGDAFVVGNQCPHARVELAEGRLHGFALECPFHGGRFDVRDGAPLAQPIRKPARTFPTRHGPEGLEVAVAAR